MVQQATIANLTKRGVHVQGWIHTACELRGDWAIEETAKGLTDIYDEHHPPWSFLTLFQKSNAAEMAKAVAVASRDGDERRAIASMGLAVASSARPSFRGLNPSSPTGWPQACLACWCQQFICIARPIERLCAAAR